MYLTKTKKVFLLVTTSATILLLYQLNLKMKEEYGYKPRWPSKIDSALSNREGPTGTGLYKLQDKQNIPRWINVADDFSIFSVIGEQSFQTLSWNSLVFNGFEREGLKTLKYKCCYRYSDGNVSSVVTGNKRYKFMDPVYTAVQVVCDISNRIPPDGAALVSEKANCDSDTIYLKPIYRTRDPIPKLAICGLMAYGSKSARELVEWIEFHLQLGGGPFIIYAYADLNANAVRVFDYYEHQGVVEKVYVPFVPTLVKDKDPRSISQAQRPRRGSDNFVTVFDFQQRARHFTSYTWVDFDEFIVPRKENITSYVHLLDFLFRKHPKAGYLAMKSEVHLTNWGKTDPNNSLIIGQYQYHSEPRSLSQKNFFLPERIKTGTIWIHDAELLPGFKKEWVDPNDAVLKHYRDCKEKWFEADMGKIPCVDHFKKIMGHIMKEEAKQIEQNVLSVIKELEL